MFEYYIIYFSIFYVTLFSVLDSKYDYDYARRWMEGTQNSLELVLFQLSLAVQHSGGLAHITYCAFDMQILHERKRSSNVNFKTDVEWIPEM